MNLSENTVLKENYTFFVANADGNTSSAEHGFYHRDTRLLKTYAWTFGERVRLLVRHAPRADHFWAHYADVEDHAQYVGVQRHVAIGVGCLEDVIELHNTSPEPQTITLELRLEADFADLFEVRGWHDIARTWESKVVEAGLEFHYTAQDGQILKASVLLSQPPSSLTEQAVSFTVSLAPGERWQLTATSTCYDSGDSAATSPSLPDYPTWQHQFEKIVAALPEPHYRPVLAQAVDDLRTLVLATDEGLFPAAGIPWFVAAFGRDALITALMMLPTKTEFSTQLALGTLQHLAAKQGTEHDDFRAEAAGKIMHEARYGELSRTGQVPHTRYYGTVDATPLFIILLRETYRVTGDVRIVENLRPHWEAALRWMEKTGDIDGDGFLEFTPAAPGQGLNVQSWKDSGDSMSHASGELAKGELAVSEVQGYAFAAYRAAADFYLALGESSTCKRYNDLADSLKQNFHEAFWLAGMNTYAMALDGDKQPLRVHNSDAGQLLWTGIVPMEVASKLVATLFSEENWSGWGVRTLGTGEQRYNPVSYHNGSVWPHDNALIASGLARYGFVEEANAIRGAMFDIASSQADKRLPELIAGYPRSSLPPVPYPAACRPQAWDAAALVYLADVGKLEP
ncbi:MAG: glycogen debranching N-terminal domain-containing protein [Deinococcota bacterium]